MSNDLWRIDNLYGEFTTISLQYIDVSMQITMEFIIGDNNNPIRLKEGDGIVLKAYYSYDKFVTFLEISIVQKWHLKKNSL
jgi:hypothetical protein